MKYTYPKNYKVNTINNQMITLKGLFGIKNLSKPFSPENTSEGLFAIPHWKLLGSTYNEAVSKVLEAIKSSRSAYDWGSGNWSEKYLRQLPIKEAFWNVQKEEIIIISAQFGLAHAGDSVETVRAVRGNNILGELPFGIYEVGIMLLTHPERLQNYADLWIDCPGDEYSFSGDGVFGYAPSFKFDDGDVLFVAHDVSNAHGDYGSASGSVSQPLETRSLGSFESLTLDAAILKVKEAGYKVIEEL